MIEKDKEPKFTITNDVATITLCRPTQHNRIAPEDTTLITEYIETANHKAKVLVITGTGEKTFSSGYTLGAIENELDDRFENMLNTLENSEIPTICALNGSVYGGATDLALCCDIRIGVKGSKLLMPASRIGLHYYPDGLRRYISILGLSVSKQLFLTAKTINDDTMLRTGFLMELVDLHLLKETVQDYVHHIMQCEPKVLKTIKHDLHQISYDGINMEGLREHYENSLKTDELKERLMKINKK